MGVCDYFQKLLKKIVFKNLEKIIFHFLKIVLFLYKYIYTFRFLILIIFLIKNFNNSCFPYFKFFFPTYLSITICWSKRK